MSAPVATKTVAPLIPVTILTGFLGAGKTTLLKRILNEPHGEKIAVIENEFGEESIDNELLFEDTKERIVEMNNGCICCTVRGDLIEMLNRLGDKRASGRFSLIVSLLKRQDSPSRARSRRHFLSMMRSQSISSSMRW